jgi:serine/threonine protein kinase
MMINKTIGKYKIIRLIGEGGMASVYEAEHEMLGTKVAIKVLSPVLSSNSQIRERFRNEAKLMASLNHPNIVKVLDFDDKQDRLSIVMELLDGEDLSEKIKKNGALSENEINNIFDQILSACQFAHEKGIVHRDIKPSNIYVLPNGEVKILDFGIAKLFGQGNEMTQTGTQIGTPIYMSPEQVKADKSIDHRSDIYSIGVTLYFALSGKLPYDVGSSSQFDIFNKIVHESLPTVLSNRFLNETIQKSCQKNRENRFQSCIEFREDLNRKLLNHSSNSVNQTIKTIRQLPQEKRGKNLLFRRSTIFIGMFLLILIGVLLFKSFNTIVYEGNYKNWNYSDTQVYGLVPLEDCRNRDYFKISQLSDGVTKVEEFNESGILQETTVIKFMEGKLQSISKSNKNGYSFNNQVFTSFKAGLEVVEKNEGLNTLLPSKSLVYRYENGLLIESYYKGFDGNIGMGPDGICRLKFERYDDQNRWGERKEEAYFDYNGGPIKFGNYHKVKYRRDERNNLLQESYWDEQNKPVLNELGIHMIKYVYDNMDNKIQEKYFGISDEPVSNSYGVGIVRYVYFNGRCVSFTRHLSNGDIAPSQNLDALDNASMVKYDYDSRGNVICTEFFDEFKNLIKTNSGYAKIIRQYDELDNCIIQDYLDCFGNRVENDQGTHRYVLTYDQYGRIYTRAYFDKNLNPTDKSGTFFMSKYKFEESGLIQSVSYWRNNNVKMTRWSGEHEVNYKYNDQGQEIECYYLDEQGNLKKMDFGCSRELTKYDNLARITSVSCFDGNVPSLISGTSVSGYHLVNFKYDNRNNLKSIEYYDQMGNPCNTKVDNYGDVSRIEISYKGNMISSQKWYLTNSDIPVKVLDCYNSECMTNSGSMMVYLHK